jgi:hypothetical protein
MQVVFLPFTKPNADERPNLVYSFDFWDLSSAWASSRRVFLRILPLCSSLVLASSHHGKAAYWILRDDVYKPHAPGQPFRPRNMLLHPFLNFTLSDCSTLLSYNIRPRMLVVSAGLVSESREPLTVLHRDSNHSGISDRIMVQQNRLQFRGGDLVSLNFDEFLDR